MQVASNRAPLRGATHRKYLRKQQIRYFNPRTPAGCDHAMLHESGLDITLIHAPSHTGCDGNKPLWSGVSGDFNPRTIAWCDTKLATNAILASTSTHAPLRGATLNGELPYGMQVASIHAPLRGVTYQLNDIAKIYSTSIHALRRGATTRPSA